MSLLDKNNELKNMNYSQLQAKLLEQKNVISELQGKLTKEEKKMECLLNFLEAQFGHQFEVVEDNDRPGIFEMKTCHEPVSEIEVGSDREHSRMSDIKDNGLLSVPAAEPIADMRMKKTRKARRIFEGMQFIMTASGGDPSGSGVPYDKDDFRNLIQKAGGSILDTVRTAEAKRSSKPTYLISDSYARTVKYIYCLAAGIPCLSHIWIQACLDQNKIVDWESYQLDSGWSLEDQRVIPPHKLRPLKDLKIYVTAESRDLYNDWKPVLTAAQANLLKPQKKGPLILIPAETEVLVTDATCPSNVVSQALKKHIPIVAPEWLVQTIILGERTIYNGHEKYTPIGDWR